MTRMTIRDMQYAIGVTQDGIFGPMSRAALDKRLSNRRAAALTTEDFVDFAKRMDVPVATVRGVVKVEAPRGSYDTQGRPSILYERHVADRNTVPQRKYRTVAPDLFGPPYGAGGYGPYSVQYNKLYRACKYDPEAALRGCSWGMFQILGENAVDIGYDSTWQMVTSMVDGGEPAHLEAFRRFLVRNNLLGHLRACRPGNPTSCVPFVSAYNGKGYRDFNYHTKLAAAITG